MTAFNIKEIPGTMKKIKKVKKLGLALGGGAVLGAAHIGVLRALDEFELSVSFIAGTSIGAFVAAFAAFGKKWDQIEEIAKDLKWMDISGISISQYGLLNNERMGTLITEHLGDKRFEDSDIPLAMIATDIASGKKVILNSGEVVKSVMASTCIPGIFIPVEMDGKLLVDGGIVENVPITPLKEMGADYIIAVDLNAGLRPKKPENIIDVILNTFDFTLMTATKLQTKEVDILITPDLSDFNMVDTDQIEDLIEKGYSEAKEILAKVV